MRCTWCIRDSKTADRCDKCGSKHLRDPSEPHTPDWSRRTLATWECKVCDRVISNTDDAAIASECPGLKAATTARRNPNEV
jgi:hypothetical protein